VVNKDWLDIAILEDYLDGKLDPRTMNRVEREALEDPFVAEALAGLSASPKKSLESISLLQKQLQERIAEQQHIKKTAVITWQRLSIAATAAVLFISVGIIFWMKQNNYQDMLVKQAKQPKEVEVIIAPKESKDTLIKPDIQVASAKAPKTESQARAIEDAIEAAKKNAYALNAKAKVKSVVTKYPAPVVSGKAELNAAVTVAQPQATRLSRSYLSAKAISPAAPAGTVINGKVLDEANGQPLENAAIYVKGTNIRTFTNNVGEFSVASDTVLKNPEITAAYIGYENAVAQARVNESNVLVLKENKGSLNEVVIRGYQKRSRDQTTGSSFVVTGKEVKDVPVANVEQLLQGKVAGLNIQNTTAYPNNGWSAFKAYLIKENPYSSEIKPGQSAEFKFEVSRSGRPTNIRVVRGLSKPYDEAATKLIRNWRKWEVPKKSNPVTVVLEY
jgi:hypothetical protein